MSVAHHNENVDPELASELSAIAVQHGCQLLEVEYRGGTLRLILDRPDGGVGVDDCAAVSRDASALLDVVDFGPKKYTLEVSSPGLDRKLYGPEDYRRFLDQPVKVTFLAPDGAGKRTMVGRLVAFHPDASSDGEIDVVERDRGITETIPVDSIQAARLVIDL